MVVRHLEGCDFAVGGDSVSHEMSDKVEVSPLLAEALNSPGVLFTLC